MAINPKVYIDKLIQGLETKGRYYNYSMKRFYSDKVGRYVTKYTLEDAKDRSRKMEVYNKLEILKFLVREWSRETGQALPDEYTKPLDDDGGSSKNKLGVTALDNFKRTSPKSPRRRKLS